MSFIDALISFIKDPKTTIASWIVAGSATAYGLIFLVILVETGIVIFPFLPGDSLLFAAGVFAADGSLNMPILLGVCWCAAIIGDQCNFFIGHLFGQRIITSGKVKAMTPERIEKSEAFLKRWGALAVFLARFFPFIRTFVPFLAGIGGMKWHHFFTFNVLGGIFWSSIFVLLGYFFGNIPFVQNNFELVIIGIIFVSCIPPLIGLCKAWHHKKQQR